MRAAIRPRKKEEEEGATQAWLELNVCVYVCICVSLCVCVSRDSMLCACVFVCVVCASVYIVHIHMCACVRVLLYVCSTRGKKRERVILPSAGTECSILDLTPMDAAEVRLEEQEACRA